ncbi:hypothetical protein [Polaromonas sp. SM01]|uniref:hypothetical protein n=1 Tax=Polaromonas sp. SM01 TaxID=3085630 RepID=UPI0029822E69|nr:hypothetical protein [Polaromonas sp. SM01]MDW5443827.1 hypothetical protein [Polaromonas sp. SM01]
MKSMMLQPLMAMLAATLLLAGGAEARAQALEVLNPPVQVKAGKKPAKTKLAGQGKTAKFIPGSQETKKERSTRLKRECKGRVNAGACEGYTD